MASPLRCRLANASGRIEFIIVLFMDWSFASSCSPPRLSTSQLLSATDRPVLLSDWDFHPIVGAHFQAHIFNRFAVGPTGSERSCWSKMPLSNRYQNENIIRVFCHSRRSLSPATTTDPMPSPSPRKNWIGPPAKARAPENFMPGAVAVVEQIVVVQEQAWTHLGVLEIGNAP